MLHHQLPYLIIDFIVMHVVPSKVIAKNSQLQNREQKVESEIRRYQS